MHSLRNLKKALQDLEADLHDLEANIEALRQRSASLRKRVIFIGTVSIPSLWIGLYFAYSPTKWWLACAVCSITIAQFVLLYKLRNQSRKLDALTSSSRMDSKPPRPKDKLRIFLELFRFILPRKVQQECFEPALNDILIDHVRARKFRSKWARRWINFAFAVRTLFMVFDCLRVMFQCGTGRIILGLLPEQFRNWWRHQ